MRRWIVLPAVLVLASACARSGGGGGEAEPVPEPFSCPAVAEAFARGQTVADPFQQNGKVVLYGKSTQGLSTQAVSTLSSGTELSVALKNPCTNPGAIAKSILRNAKPGLVKAGGSGRRFYSWTLQQELTLTELKKAADSDSCVVGIADSILLYPNDSDALSDPLVANQGHMSMLGAKESYQVIYSHKPSVDKPVVIAVIDTGADTAHDDLKNVFWQNRGEIAGNKIDDDKNGYVDDVIGYNFGDNSSNPHYSTSWSGSQHGTHVAGLAAAQGGNNIGVSGVMGTGARIMVLNVFGKFAGAYPANTANAIEYATDNGADVINMSIGGMGRSASYEAAIAYAIQKGVTIFAAAGNESAQISQRYFMTPAAYSAKYPGMVAVGSVDSESWRFSSYSNWNPIYVKIGAPGSENSAIRRGLLSTWPGNTYARIQGTSMATPVAAGSAALAIQMMRALGYAPSPTTIEGVMSMSSRELPALRNRIRDGRVLNMKRLADFIQTNYPSRVDQENPPFDPGVPGYKPCAVPARFEQL